MPLTRSRVPRGTWFSIWGGRRPPYRQSRSDCSLGSHDLGRAPPISARQQGCAQAICAIVRRNTPSAPNSSVANAGLAFLFPGQGAFDGGVFSEFRLRFCETEDVFRDIDRVALHELGICPSDVLARVGPSVSIDTIIEGDADALQFAIFGLSVATFRVLEARKLAPGVLVGHSFGEIAALTCGGYFNIEEASWILSQRIRALREIGPASGAMLAVATSEERAQHLAGLIGDAVAVAVVNGPHQVVLAGTNDGISVAERVVRALQLGNTRVRSPHAFHFPTLMQAAEPKFRAALRQVRPRTPIHRVYSPIFGGYYPASSFSPEVLADHLLLPVRFDQAVQRLLSEGINGFVECGARDALVRSVEAISMNTGLRCSLPALPAGSDVVSSIERVISVATSRSYPPMKLEMPTSPHAPAVSALSRDQIFRNLAELFGSTLDYPVSVFTEEVALEADLAIDSVKQSELSAAVQKLYQFERAPLHEQWHSTATFGQLVDRVVSQLDAIASGTKPSAPVLAVQAAAKPIDKSPAPLGVDRGTVRAELSRLFAQALEYPESVFTDDVALEADLAIDSVKQTELIGKVAQRFGLQDSASSLRPAGGATFRDVVDFICQRLADPKQAAAVAPIPNIAAPLYPSAASVARDLAGRVALVTDGAAAVGQAIVKGLLARGAEVIVLHDMPQEVEQSLEAEARAMGGKMHTVRAASTQHASAEVLLNQLERIAPTLDLFVNNAMEIAVPLGDGCTEFQVDELPFALLKRTVLYSQYAIRSMQTPRDGRLPGGVIVNLLPSRLHGSSESIGMKLFKAGIEALTHHLASEYDQSNIRANTLIADPRKAGVVVDLMMFLTSEASRGLNGHSLRSESDPAWNGHKGS